MWWPTLQAVLVVMYHIGAHLAGIHEILGQSEPDLSYLPGDLVCFMWMHTYINHQADKGEWWIYGRCCFICIQAYWHLARNHITNKQTHLKNQTHLNQRIKACKKYGRPKNKSSHFQKIVHDLHTQNCCCGNSRVQRIIVTVAGVVWAKISNLYTHASIQTFPA